MKISKVIFHIKPIPSHPWWECKNQENTAKDSHHSETSNILNQGDLLDISVESFSDPEINTSNKSITETKTPNSPFFDKLKTSIKPNNSIIIAGDKYNDTPQINCSFDDTVGDITVREVNIWMYYGKLYLVW